MARNLNVQTPGEAPANPDDQKPAADLAQPPGEAVDAGAEAGTSPAQDELLAKIAALEAENKRLAEENAKKAARDPEANRKAAADADAEFDRASSSITRHEREKFKQMHAHEVDPSKLVAAVLTKDGWVAPDQSGQKPRG